MKKENFQKNLTKCKMIDIIIFVVRYGRLAQLVEHSLDVRVVRGSSPLTSTKRNDDFRRESCRFFFAFSPFTQIIVCGEKVRDKKSKELLLHKVWILKANKTNISSDYNKIDSRQKRR